MRTASTVIVVFVSLAVAFGSAAIYEKDAADRPGERRASVAFVGEPVAVIKDLPQYVSNGTPYSLDGSYSTDSDGSIVSYSWKVSVAGLSTNLSGISVTYTFTLIDTYTIELTVTDNESKASTDQEIVESVPDSDSDDLPDWWEQKYFGNLIQGPLGDYDSDGYLNADELADGTDPASRDAGPSILSQIPIWGYAAIAAGIAAVVVVILWPIIKRKQKEREKKKIEYALEIEKALEEEK